MKKPTTIAEGKYLGLYEIDTWEFCERPNAQGVVAILPITENDEIVLVEQFRVPIQKLCIEIPAGLIGDEPEHRGESLVSTAARELKEETGYAAADIRLLLSSPTSPGMTPEITHFFVAKGLTRVEAGGGVDGEDITVHHVPRRQLNIWLQEKIDKGIAVDFKIHAALQLSDQT